jgi:hypothetical protein
MLWARSDGETFGLSIGEFCFYNKPVFYTKAETGYNYHCRILHNKGIYYDNNTLYNLIKIFDKNKEHLKKHNWNAYSEFTPENVMQIFKNVFIN